LLCQLVEDGKELLRLADEQPVIRKGLDRGHCTPTSRYLGRPNDRNGRELAAEEDGGLRHDQVRLELLAALLFAGVRMYDPIPKELGEKFPRFAMHLVAGALVAVFAAVAAEGPDMEVDTIVVYAAADTVSPCGACRQAPAGGEGRRGDGGVRARRGA